MEMSTNYRKIAQENPSKHYKNLEVMIENAAKNGLFHLEFDLCYNSWFEEAHKELLEKKGFNVKVFELLTPSKPTYVSIRWSNQIKPSSTGDSK